MQILVITGKTLKRVISIFLGLGLVAVMMSQFISYEKEIQTEAPSLGTSLQDKVVGIDPGHGGYDPGFFTDEVVEGDIVLNISLKLQRLLEQAGAEVVLTRDEDEDLIDDESDDNGILHHDLDDRVKMMEDNNVDMMVSIHANSIPSSRWRGAQTFYYSEDEAGEQLAATIQDEFIRVLQNTGRSPLGANYFLLRELQVPSAIIEVGFLSNPNERQLLTNELYQERVAWSIYLGMVKFATSWEG